MWLSKSVLIIVIICLVIILNESESIRLNSSKQKQKQTSPISLSIIHFNDFHARFEATDLRGDTCRNETECIGGYSRLYNQITTMKKNYPDSIVLNGGDVAMGTFWYNIGGWNISQKFMNKLPIDAEVLGNHEFDRSIRNVVSYIKALKYPIVTSNIDDTLEPTMQNIYTKSHIIKRNGKKIGIIGVVASNFDKITKTKHLKFLPESSSVNAEADRLVRDEGVFTNIVLSHAGYEVDQDIAANASERISLIVGGHSHTLLLSEGTMPIPDIVKGAYPTIIKSSFGHKVAIVQAAAYCRLLGNITIFLNENGELDDYSGKPILLDQSIPQDEEINKELLRVKNYIEAQGNAKIGYTTVPLDHRECNYKECTFGDFITDAMLEIYSNKLKQKNMPTYDIIALMNSRGIRKSLKKGDITLKDLSSAIPYKDTIDIGEIDGKYLKELFESTSVFNSGHIPKLLQVSGVKVVYNISRPEGDRVISIKVLSQTSLLKNYEDLDLNRTYNLATVSFIINGGDCFDIISKNIKNKKKGPIDLDLLQEYLESNSPLQEMIQDRLIFYT